MEESRVLCGANAYREKYYFDPAYARLPQRVQEELKILCVTFAEEIGGTILLRFSADGSLQVETAKDEGDYYYDDIEAELAVRRLLKENRTLLLQLELFHRAVILRQIPAQAASALPSEGETASPGAEASGRASAEEAEALLLAERYAKTEYAGEISLEDYIEELLRMQ